MRNLRRKNRVASDVQMSIDALEEELREALEGEELELDLEADDEEEDVPIEEDDIEIEDVDLDEEDDDDADDDDDEDEDADDDDDDEDEDADDDDDEDEDADDDDDEDEDADDDDDDEDEDADDEEDEDDGAKEKEASVEFPDDETDEIVAACDELDRRIASIERRQLLMTARAHRSASTVRPGIEDRIGDQAHGGDASVSSLRKHSVACGTDKEVFGKNSNCTYIAKITRKLDRVANELEERGMKRMAFRIDQLSDKLDASVRRH